ncbi:hypothetical protein [Nostoc sp.]|uniref:hypothetical protein n=1 Tax=Nostoc sp. TaxID=1180 RepID=UPI002FF65399
MSYPSGEASYAQRLQELCGLRLRLTENLKKKAITCCGRVCDRNSYSDKQADIKPIYVYL